MELDIKKGNVGIVLDDEGTVRGTFLGTSDSTSNIKLLEECLSNEYGGSEVTFKSILFSRNDCIFMCEVDILDKEDGTTGTYEFTVSQSLLFSQIEMTNCYKCNTEQEANQRFCVKCNACLS